MTFPQPLLPVRSFPRAQIRTVIFNLFLFFDTVYCMKSFEENLSKLEELTNNIRRQDISIEDALENFEEGIKLAKTLEKDIEKIEGKIQILMNQPVKPEKASGASAKGIEPQLDLFAGTDSMTGSAGAPEEGLRQ